MSPLNSTSKASEQRGEVAASMEGLMLALGSGDGIYEAATKLKVSKARTSHHDNSSPVLWKKVPKGIFSSPVQGLWNITSLSLSLCLSLVM